MGCGQSKIHLYPRKSKSKANGKKSVHAGSDADADEDEAKLEDPEKDVYREREKHDDELDMQDSKIPETECELSVSLLRAKNLSLLQNQEISTSQQNFFQMLDKKIEDGPDYDSTSETEMALEEARLNALVQHWESASLTASVCSSGSRSLQSTPVHQVVPLKQQPQQQQPTSSQCLVQNNLPLQAMKAAAAADFLPHSAALKLQHPLEHPHSEHQQFMISQMDPQVMQQMTTVPQLQQHQQLSMNMLAQKSVPMSSASLTATVLQTPNHSQLQPNTHTHLMNMTAPVATPGMQQLLTNASTSPKRMIDSRVLMTAQPQAYVAMQMQPQALSSQQHQYPMSTSPQGFVSSARSAARPPMNIIPNTPLNLPMQMVYYNQPTMQQRMNSQLTTQQQQFQPSQQPSCYGEVAHNMEPQSSTNSDYRFPPAISVQRLAPQVQRQLRETQELIKDSCPQLYAAGYGSPGPPVRSQARNPARRPTLETQFSQELS